jgi:hypothetical protein
MSNADSLLDQIRSYMWDAVYVPYEHVDG